MNDRSSRSHTIFSFKASFLRADCECSPWIFAEFFGLKSEDFSFDLYTPQKSNINKRYQKWPIF